MVWIICMAWKASVWIKIQGYSASHKGVLGELHEGGQELDELEEQLGELVEDSLGLGESGREVLTFFWLSRESVSQGRTR